MTKIQPELLDELRQQLESERDYLLRQLAAGSQDLGRNPDKADLALDYAQREQQTALTAVHQERLKGVQAALGRMDAGTYGICEDCGDRIDPARLKVLPSATTCIKCQRAQH